MLRSEESSVRAGSEPEVHRLLIVEDDELQYRVTRQHLLQAAGLRFVIDRAVGYEDGLAKLSGGSYAVCLLDYRLGERDGLELLRSARARGCRTPVIFLTADASTELDLAAMDAGAADYLVKSEISPRLLERSIRYAMKLASAMEELHQLATRDGLTGVLNRREFERVLKDEAERAGRFGRRFSLVLLDLDHFKRINDTHGHPAGDEVLREVARRLQEALRTVDRLGRFGGEEFAALLVETDDRTAQEVAGRMVQAIRAEPIPVVQDLALAVTVSAGVALSPRDGVQPAELIAAADRALYAAKHAGRNQVAGV